MAIAPDGQFAPGYGLGDVGMLARGNPLTRLQILLQQLAARGGGPITEPVRHLPMGGHEIQPFVPNQGGGPAEPTHGFEGQPLPIPGYHGEALGHLGLVPLPQVHGRGGGLREGVGLRGHQTGGLQRAQLSPRIQQLLETLLAQHFAGPGGPQLP